MQPFSSPRAFAVTFRSVMAIAIPMTLAHVTTPLIGVTDTAVIGQLGSAVLIGAVALGAVLFDILGTSFNFLRLGTTGLVAQAVGAGDEGAESLTLWRALSLAALIGVAVVLLQGFIVAAFLGAMGASEGVNEATRDYFAVRVWAAPLMFANYAILGWLLGLGRAATGLILQIVLATKNILGSILLVLVFDFGVVGVAAASVVAEAVALVCGLSIVAAARKPIPRLGDVLEPLGLKRMLGVNRDILIRSVLLIVAFAFFTSASARFGDLTLAANAILMNLFLVTAFMLDGLATAAEQLGGRAVGARYKPAFTRTVRLTLLAGVVVSGVLAAAALVGRGPFLALMTTSEAVKAAANSVYIFAALTPVAGFIAFVMDGLYVGATWTAAMRNMMILSSALFVALWWALTPLLENQGLWLALLGYLLIRGLLLWALVPRLTARTFGS